MTNQTGRIAVIPARGGSKRIPRKNVKLFAGQPMISYAIRAAIECDLFDHVVVSTDDDDIADPNTIDDFERTCLAARSGVRAKHKEI